ncbi:MAG: endonuclease, partial [Bacteroidota bacterium]
GGGGGGDCEPVMGNYYECIEDFIAAGGNCAELKTQLFSLIDDHTVFPYTGSPFDVWDFMCQYDMRLNDAGTNMIMWDVYSDNPSGAEPYEYECSDRNTGTSTGMEGDTWNREHVFPQSWWGGGSSPIQRSDVNNLLPSDTEVNSQKGSFQLGVVSTPTFTSLNGTKVGTPANGCAPTVFEPIDEYKGDMARMYFYIATRYEDQVAGWENNSSSSDDALNGDSYTVFEPCLLNLLLKWHKDDPVSQKELDRNEGVFMEQNNRNPYIDHPEYVDLVWGISNGTIITTPCQVLPVELLNFEARADKDHISLNWSTASEFNNSHFKLERSEDGKLFKQIARIEGNGTTLEQAYYNYEDQDVIPDVSYYYRLKQVDFDDVFEYSEIRMAKLKPLEDDMRLYPNPIGSFSSLKINCYATKLTKGFFIMDIHGRNVLEIEQKFKNIGWNTIDIDIQSLPSGTYVFSDKQDNTKRFIKTED